MPGGVLFLPVLVIQSFCFFAGFRGPLAADCFWFQWVRGVGVLGSCWCIWGHLAALPFPVSWVAGALLRAMHFGGQGLLRGVVGRVRSARLCAKPGTMRQVRGGVAFSPVRAVSLRLGPFYFALLSGFALY